MHTIADSNVAQDVSRRRLLQIGGVSALGLGLPDLLRSERVVAATSEKSRSGKSCIFIVQYGGAPQQDMWDLKPDAPENIRGAFKPKRRSGRER